MSGEKNKHGLARYIPTEIAREVRRACGFGCVICGASVIMYEHIEPEFHEATEHDPDRIALLCAGCHDKVTRKFWSKEKVWAARRAPACKTRGFSWGDFDYGQNQPEIRIGGMTLRSCPTPVEIRGTPVISIEPPEESGAPFRLSASFFDDQGAPSLLISANEWKLLTGVWDAECTGGRIEIRSNQGPHTLILRAEPPRGIAVEALRMRVHNVGLVADEKILEVQLGSSVNRFQGCIADGCMVGLSLG